MADSDTNAGSSDSTDSAAAEPEYSFEGFDLQFSFKVALTPPASTSGPAVVPARSGAG